MKPTSSTETPDTIDDDAPPLTQADFDRAHLRVGGRDVSRAEWQAAVRANVGKRRINIALDAPIVEHVNLETAVERPPGCVPRGA